MLSRSIVLFILSFRLYASTLFAPDSDTAALMMIVSNTASSVSNTLKILEVAKKTSEKIDHYNFIAMRRYFIARRIEQHARDLIETKKMKPKGLQEINQMLLRLKTNLQGLKSNIDFLAKDVMKAEDFTNKYWDKVLNAMEDSKEAHTQELSSASEGTVTKHVQNTAMNTALSSKILSKMRQDNIDYQRTDIGLKKGEAMENLRREQHYREWIGLPDKRTQEGVL